MRFLLSIVLAFLFVTSASAQVFYGVTRAGGSGGGGTIFKMPTDGSSLSTEYNFSFNGYVGRNFDYCRMVQAPNGKLYGVAPNGGQADTGVLFEFDPISSNYEIMYEFSDETVGLNPFGSLAFGPNGNLYGTTNNGGLNWTGTIFEYIVGSNSVVKAADFHPSIGRTIFSGMVLAGDNMFYGVTLGGGANDFGTLYQFDPSTFALTKKKDFSNASTSGYVALRVPVLYNGKLYGTALQGGTNSFGCIYEYDPSTDVLTNIYNFSNTGDGKNPNATMTVVGSLLYGVTSEGGSYNYGTIFNIHPSSGIVNVAENFDFADTGKGDVNVMTLAPDGMLYGTSEFGGSGGGTLFRFDPSIPGSLTNLYSFAGGAGDGHTPKSGLTLANNGVLYGTTAGGGSNHAGVLFSYDPTNPGVNVLLQSNYASEGAYPLTAPVQHPNGKLYGVTPYGGTSGAGILYEFDPITKLYQVVYEFTGSPDGANPEGSLALHPNGYLYGMAQNGGANGVGLIYEFDPSSSSMNTMIDFDVINNGARPHGSLTLANGIFYGVTAAGGLDDYGVLFSFDPGTMAFDNLFNFGGNFGVAPQSDLVYAPDGYLYGTTQFGGALNVGVLFKFDLSSFTETVIQHFGSGIATGAEPIGSLLLDDDGKLWGMTSLGGAFNAGTLFFHYPAFSSFGTMKDFDYGPTGGVPRGTLAKGAGDKLYGFTSHGGNGGWGVLFEYNPGSNTLQKKFDLTPATGATPMFGALSTVALPPSISFITPYAAIGSTVGISGENFNPDPLENIVYFGPVRATVVFASTTDLQVIVPNGAEFGPISVTVANLTAESPTTFTPQFAFNGGIPGSYETAFTKTGGISDKRLAMADLDGDGLPDAVVGDEGAASVHVYRNTSTPGVPNFDDKVDFSVDSNPYTVDIADLDGDGRLDVVASNPNGVAMIRNTSTIGNISFDGPVVYYPGSGFLAVTAADLSGDGKPEVIGVGAGTGVVYVFQNNSTPGNLDFILAAQLQTSPVSAGVVNLWDVVASDVDGDNKLDIVVPVPDDPTTDSFVAIFMNNSSVPFGFSSFAPPVKISTPGYSAGLDVADLDFDGLPELVVGSGIDFAGLRVIKNLGGGAFGAALNLPVSHQVWDPKVADVDGDGRPDILAAHNGNGRIAVLKNQFASGLLQVSDFELYTVTTGGSPLNVSLCDVDLDGLPELLVANEAFNQLQIFHNKNAYPRPIITSASPPYAAVGVSVVIAGANFSSTPSNNAVYFGATQGTVTDATTTSLTVTVPSGATYAPVLVTTNGLTGTSPTRFAPDFTSGGAIDANSFAAKVDETTGTTPEVLAVGDLNGDGKSDLVIPNNGSNTVSVMQNQSTPGTADFGTKVDFATVPAAPLVAAIGDLDGDQQRDFVVSSGDGLSIHHHANTIGNILPTTFVKTEIILGSNQVGIALGDIDGDGKQDIVTVSANANYVYFLRNLTIPDAIFVEDFPIAAFVNTGFNNASILSVGDLDGDGRPEVVIGYADPGELFSVYQNFNNPGGIFADAFTRIDFNTGPVTKPYAIALADVDGDGKVDMIVADAASALVSVYRNIMTGPGAISTSSFEAGVPYTMGTTPVLVTCADLDGDLRPDIITSNYGSGTVSVLKNNISSPGTLTASSFLAKVDYTVGTQPSGVVVADIDADNRPDLVATSESGTVATLLNDSELPIPVIGVIEDVTTTSFRANWGIVLGATEYRVDVSADNFATMVSGYNDLTVASTTLDVTGLTSGLTYKFRVRAANVTGSTANSSETAVTLIPEAPTNVMWSGVSQTSFVALWDAMPGATSYRVDVSADNFITFVIGYEDLTVPATSLAVTGLSPGSNYEFRVRTVNSASTSANSGELGVLTIPSAPDATAATVVTTSSFTANWIGTSPTVEYRLDVSDVIDFSTLFGGYDNFQVVATSADLTGFSPGTTYYYRVRAGNGSGFSENSDVISVTMITATPDGGAATGITQTSFTAEWPAQPSATAYRLDVSIDNFVNRLAGYDDLQVIGTSQDVTGLSPGTDYQYQIRAVNSGGTSFHSASVAVLTIPSAPDATAATAVTASTFTANWLGTSPATEYRLDVSDVNDFSTLLPGLYDLTLSVAFFDVSGLNAGTTYYYRVRAGNPSGYSENSDLGSVLLVPAAPNATPATAIAQKSFTANWDATVGANEYRLDVSTDAFATRIPGYDDLQVFGTSYSVIDLMTGMVYKYRVRAVNSSGVSTNSLTVGTMTIAAEPVANEAVDITESSFTASWGTVNGADDYWLDVSDVSDFTTVLPEYDNLQVFAPFMSVTGLNAGTTYFYRVRAANTSGTSGISNVVSVLLAPPAPNAIAATAIGQTTFTTNWETALGADGYRLDVSINDFVTQLPGYDDVFVPGTSYDVSGLTPGTDYKFRVRATNGSGTSANSTAVSALTIPANPVANSATGMTALSFTANWTTVPGATEYRLDVSDVSDFSTFLPGYFDLQSITTFKGLSGLNPGATYFYRVRAANGSGASGNSNVVSATLVPDAPSATPATSIGQTTFTANWAPVLGADNYLLDVSFNDFFTQVPGYDNLLVPGATYNVSGLTPGMSYKFRVRAVNNSGTSSYSNAVATLTIPADPVANNATAITAVSFTANWNAVTGAEDYWLDVSNVSDFSAILPAYDNLPSTATFQGVTGLSPGATYFYRVRAANSSGTSGNSNVVTAALFSDAPIATAATGVGETTFTANWEAVVGAIDYRLDVSADDFVSRLAEYDNLPVSGTSHDVLGLTPGTPYWFRIRATTGGGPSANSEEVFVRTVPAAPVINAGSLVTTVSAEIAWEPITGAVEYHLDVANDINFVSMVAGYDNLLLTTYFTDVTGLSPGSTYFCRVRASNESGTSGNSPTHWFILAPIAPDAQAGSSITETEFRANWNGANGATEYRLDVSINNFASRLTGYDDQPVTDTFYPVTGLTPGTVYKYRVRTINQGGLSGNSNEVSVITVPPAPVLNAANNVSYQSFSATWTSAQGADSYLLDVSDDNFVSFLTIYSNYQVAGNTLDISDLTPGTTYQFRVRSVNASGVSAFSNVVFVSAIPSAPAAISATNPGETSFTANWIMSPGAVVYQIDVSDDNFATVLPTHEAIVVAGGTSWTITGLAGGVPYQYRVRAGNNGGFSDNSNVITIALKPGAPTATDATNVTQTTFTANWSSSNGATGYMLDVSVDDFSTMLSNYDNVPTNSTSFIVVGLDAGVTYKYRVRAQNGIGVSSNSNEIPVTLVPATPLATAATDINLTGFTANWDAAVGADSYYLDISDDDFITRLPNYDNLSVSGLSQQVTGLNTLSLYKYRVRSSNGSGTSPNSNPISAQPDTPAPPTVSTFSPPGGPPGTVVTVTGTNFYINQLAVSFNSVVATSITLLSPTSLTVVVPASATPGKITVTVGTQSGNSATDFIADDSAPVITLPNSPASPKDTEFALDVTITDNQSQDNVQAYIYFRSVAGTDDFQATPGVVLQRQGTTTTYQTQIPASKVTSSGVEYYVKATSYGGLSTSQTETILVTYTSEPGMAIQILDVGTQETDYRIFSIPMDIIDKTVAAVLEDDLNPSDRKNWRVSHYNTATETTTDLTSSSTLDAGQGYWLIVKDQKSSFDTGPGKTVATTRGHPFAITLKPGWNQIGNPYNFNLWWQDIVDANNTVSSSFSNQVRTYRAGWGDKSILNKLEGAFIKNTSAGDITIKIPAQYNLNAGRGQDTKDTRPLDDENWKVEFTLRQGNYFNAISGFGMNAESDEGQDRHDAFTMPRFFDQYIEINHTRPSQDDPFSLDVVPTAASHTWEFDVESNIDGENMAIEWDNSYFGDNDKGLVLWDENLQFGTDMRRTNKYEFTRSQSRRFKVYFGSADEVADKAAAEHLVLHNVFPNPTDSEVKVAFSVPSAGEVTFYVYDLLGRKVWSDAANFAKGYHEVDLTGRFTTGQGMVIVQVGMAGEMQQKRLVIK